MIINGVKLQVIFLWKSMYPQKMIEDSKDKVDVIRKRFPQWKNGRILEIKTVYLNLLV